jgi:hypothetical protein
MKHRILQHKPLTPFFNLGLHYRAPVSAPRGADTGYQRKNETLENPIRKAVRMTEFINFFQTLLESRAHIAVINNGEESNFFYADWLEGSYITCYEDS